jgi:hypothetical protein
MDMPDDFANTVLNFSYQPSGQSRAGSGNLQTGQGPVLRIAETPDGPVPYLANSRTGETKPIRFIVVDETQSATEVVSRVKPGRVELVLAVGASGNVSGLMFPDVVVAAMVPAVDAHGYAVSRPTDSMDLSQWVTEFDAQGIEFHSELVNSLTPSTFECQAPRANHIFASPAPCRRHPNAPYVPIDIDI